MRYGRTATALTTVLVGVAVVSPSAAAADVTATPYYEVVQVGVTTVVAFNDHLQAVGTMNVPDVSPFHAFLWEDGTVTDIGNLFGARWSNAADINEKGWVIGAVSAETGRSYLWRNGTLINLDTLGDDYFAPSAINDRRQIVGTSHLSDGQPHAFLWQQGRFTELGIFAATDINNHGEVIGDLPVPLSSKAARWRHGVLTELNVPGVLSFATEINDRGEIVGSYQTAAGDNRAFLWQKGKVTDLGTLGGRNTFVADINDHGQIVGSSETADGATHPFLWQRGRMIDLVTRGVDLAGMAAINNHGDLATGIALYLRR